MTLPISIIRCVSLCIYTLFSQMWWSSIFSDSQQNSLQKILSGFQMFGFQLATADSSIMCPRSATWMQDSGIFFKTKQVHQLQVCWVWQPPMSCNTGGPSIWYQQCISCKIKWFRFLGCLLGFCRIQKASKVILYIYNYLFVCHCLFHPLLRDIWCDICVNSIGEML